MNEVTKYINTPFAYTRTQKGLTLLQQHIMVKVSSHLQDYFKRYFESSELQASCERPKPVMSAQALADMPPIRISLSEIGMSSGSYRQIREALEKILTITIAVDTVDDYGVPIKRIAFLFSRFDLPVTDKGTTVKKIVLGTSSDVLEEVKVDRLRGYVDVWLNKEAVTATFDMSQGYVTHPENIAKIGRVENMPLMYYLVRHKMNNFKLSKARVTPTEIREYFGMIKRDTVGGPVTKVQYAQFSRLREKVIKPALADIRRAYDAGQIDFYFEAEEVRPEGRKRVEPTCIVFRKVGVGKASNARYRSASEAKLCRFLLELYPTLDGKRVGEELAKVPTELWTDFKNYAYKDLQQAVERPHRWDGSHEDFVYFLLAQWCKSHVAAASEQQPLPEETDAKPAPLQGAEKWEAFTAAYKGKYAPLLEGFTFGGIADDGAVTIRCTRALYETFNELLAADASDERQRLADAFRQFFGEGVRQRYVFD